MIVIDTSYPIETAPRDGARIMLFAASEWRIGHYKRDEHRSHDKITYASEGWVTEDPMLMTYTFCSDKEPTHWMPLPPPPKAA